MLALSRELPGTIVLHDFFLSDLLGVMEHSGWPTC